MESIGISKDDLRRALVMGGQRAKYVIPTGIRQSLKGMHPLGGIPEKLRYVSLRKLLPEFLQSMDIDDRRRLKSAEKYWADTLIGSKIKKK